MTTKSFFVLIFIFCSKIVASQNPEKVNPVLLNEKWDARWIKHPETPNTGEGVYLFRKVFNLKDVSEHFIINISADARYKLYVNGKYVCNGPATGDLLKWRFETVDIAKYLTTGTNTIAAIVWNLGNLNNPPQISAKTGFILQGNSEVENVLNTNNSWKVHKDTSLSAFFIDDVLPSWVAVPGEKFKAANHPWNWKEINFNDSDWKNAKAMENNVG